MSNENQDLIAALCQAFDDDPELRGRIDFLLNMKPQVPRERLILKALADMPPEAREKVLRRYVQVAAQQTFLAQRVPSFLQPVFVWVILFLVLPAFLDALDEAEPT